MLEREITESTPIDPQEAPHSVKFIPGFVYRTAAETPGAILSPESQTRLREELLDISKSEPILRLPTSEF